MPRKRRTRIPTPAWETRGSLTSRLFGHSGRLYAAAGIAVLAIAAVAMLGAAYWSEYRENQGRPESVAVEIGDTKIPLRFFTQRVKSFVQQSGGPAQTDLLGLAIPATVDQLVEEVALRRFGSELGASVTEEEIKNQVASQLAIKPDDPDFEKKLQETLDATGYTREEYRQMAEASLLKNKARDKMILDLPQSALSIHYRQIIVGSQAEAEQIKQEIEGGADFASLAKARSLDSSTRDKGGDVGWMPKDVLPAQAADQILAAEVGKVEIIAGTAGAILYEVLEAPVERTLDEGSKPKLGEAKLREWVESKRQELDVRELVSTDIDKLQWLLDRAYKVG